eukprot:6103339-Heterocapsa_arctica.AAC.1
MNWIPNLKTSSIVKYWVDHTKCGTEYSESKIHKGHKKIAKLAKLMWNKSFGGKHKKASSCQHKQRQWHGKPSQQ